MLDQAQKRSILSHLDELLMRARKIIFFLIFCSGLGYYLSPKLVEYLQIPLKKQMHPDFKLVYIQPFEKFWVLIKLSMILGSLLAFPYIFYQAFAFLKPGLKSKEKRFVIFGLMFSTICAACGIFAAYIWVIPYLIKMVVSLGSLDALPLLSLSSYINTVVGVFLLCALLCELPLVMISLNFLGLVSAKTWVKQRKFSIVINAVISAILSPPDPLSMIAMMVPIHSLYEIGLIGVYAAEFVRKKKMDQSLTNKSQHLEPLIP
jgi:sec-independent protein translocase protein TatC